MNEKLVKYSKVYFIIFLIFLPLSINFHNKYLLDKTISNYNACFIFTIITAVCGITTLIMIYLMEFSITIGKPVVYKNSFSNYDKLKRYLRKKIKKQNKKTKFKRKEN